MLSSQHHCNVPRSICACSRVPLMLLSQRLYSNFWLRQLAFLVLLRLPFHDKTNMIYWKFQSPFLIYAVIITCKTDVIYRKCRSCPCARCKYGTSCYHTSPCFILRPAFARCVYGTSRYYMIHLRNRWHPRRLRMPSTWQQIVLQLVCRLFLLIFWR